MPNNDQPQASTKIINKVSYAFATNSSGNNNGDSSVEKQGELIRKTGTDIVIVEQPLQITLSWQEQKQVKTKVFTITMRTPGHDVLLIKGLLHSERVIKKLSDVKSITLDSDDVTGEGKENEWLVVFNEGITPDLSSLERYMMSYSSCGLCGTTSLKTLQLKTEINLSFPEHKAALSPQSLLELSNTMRKQQALFDKTGGVHGAALFDQHLNLQHTYEDIGRHNAVDKVIGALLTALPLVADTVSVTEISASKNTDDNSCNEAAHQAPLWLLLVSGRISFEIVQKAIMAGINVLVAVGAPSDLAIQAAKQFDLTLIGFVSNKGFNVYHGDWRLTPVIE
jgi:FdhD protein